MDDQEEAGTDAAVDKGGGTKVDSRPDVVSTAAAASDKPVVAAQQSDINSRCSSSSANGNRGNNSWCRRERHERTKISPTGTLDGSDPQVCMFASLLTAVQQYRAAPCTPPLTKVSTSSSVYAYHLKRAVGSCLFYIIRAGVGSLFGGPTIPHSTTPPHATVL